MLNSFDSSPVLYYTRMVSTSQKKYILNSTMSSIGLQAIMLLFELVLIGLVYMAYVYIPNACRRISTFLASPHKGALALV